MLRTIPISVAVACWNCGLGAAPITLINFSFELPATGKILGWDRFGCDNWRAPNGCSRQGWHGAGGFPAAAVLAEAGTMKTTKLIHTWAVRR